jgi:hypothetical protein
VKRAPRKIHWALVALAALGLARLLPEHGAGLWLRLAFATLVLLAPGALVARALRQSGPAATLVWSLAATALALGVVFVFHTALWVAFLVLAGVVLAAAPFAVRRLPVLPPVGTVTVMAAGVGFGLLLWHVAGSLQGDGLFHLARVRKLGEFGDLHLRSVVEFHDGGLHQGYAFPLWHGFLALVAKVAGVDPASVVLHGPSVLAPFAFGVAYEAGVRLFNSVAAGFAVLLAQVSLIALAAGHGGSYVFLSLPPTAARQLVVPAVLAVAFAAIADRSQWWYAAVAAGGLSLAFIHVTYAVFLCVPLAGYVIARTLLARREVVRGAAVLGALAAPTLVVALWAHTLARTAASYTPDDVELRRALRHYAGDLDVFSPGRYRVAPDLLSRGGAVAVAALVLVPLALLAARRRFAAYVLGGSVAVLGLVLFSFAFPHVADVVSLSQARRLAGFVPFAFAFAGGLLALSSAAGLLVLPAALGAGIGLQLAYPGDFGYGLREGGPALAAWIALWGGLAALVVGSLLQGRGELRRRALAPIAALLFVSPVAVHGFAHWSPRTRDARADLTPGLITALRARVPNRDVVFADLETSYRIAAYVPVYIAASLPYHVADTKENHRYERVRAVRRFFSTGDLAIPRAYRAGWLVLRRPERLRGRTLPPVYRDGSFVLYRLR